MTSPTKGPRDNGSKTKMTTVLLVICILLIFQNSVVILSYQFHSGQVKESAAVLQPPKPVARTLVETTKTESNAESIVKIPTHAADGSPYTLEERLRHLELKVNAFQNFGIDPFIGSKIRATCKNSTDLIEYGCTEALNSNKATVDLRCPGLFDHPICLDLLPPPVKGEKKVEGEPPCLVYDFGIRKQPHFGATMARSFGCEVHAFDPSPISKEFWNSPESDFLRKLPNYHFHEYGAGGVDGDVTLNEYDWGQVSIIRFPQSIIDCNVTESSPTCKRRNISKMNKTFKLPVKTLATIRKELGHEHRKIDIMKVDVEGSEFAFLESMIDTIGCDFLEQLTVEWHHMTWDGRYGEGSSPHINALTTLLDQCGLKMFFKHSDGGFKSQEKTYYEMGLDNIRYNLNTYMKVYN